MKLCPFSKTIIMREPKMYDDVGKYHVPTMVSHSRVDAPPPKRVTHGHTEHFNKCLEDDCMAWKNGICMLCEKTNI